MNSPTCNTCRWWGKVDDLSNCAYGVRSCGRIGHGLAQGALRPDGATTYATDSFDTENINTDDQHFEPAFLTGPDFGCIHHQAVEGEG